MQAEQITSLIARVTEIIKNARREGRHLSADEWSIILMIRDEARADLVNAIASAPTE